MYEKVRSLAAQISAWAWPLKFIVGATISAFAGGGVLTFLLQNAAYSYALTYGFRPPVEGVPYVGAMVTFGSVSLLLIGATLSIFFIVMTREIMIRLIDRVDESMPHIPSALRPITLFRSLASWKAIVLIVALSAFITTIQIYANAFDPPKTEICAWPLLLCTPEEKNSIFILAMYFVTGVIILTMLWRPSLVWLGTALVVTLYYLWIGLSVLPADGYARLLRTTGFGGGLKVTLELSDSGSGGRYIIDTNLLIRSATHVIVYDEKRKYIDEYPLSNVWMISNMQGGLHELAFTLPPKANLLQR